MNVDVDSSRDSNVGIRARTAALPIRPENPRGQWLPLVIIHVGAGPVKSFVDEVFGGFWLVARSVMAVRR